MDTQARSGSTRLASDPVQVSQLASGIDAFYLSGRGSLPDRWSERLDQSKARAADGAIPMVEFGGVSFEVSPRSLGRYAYRLSHRNGLIGLTSSDHLPTFRVQPLTTALHSMGPEVTVDWFMGVVEAECGPVDWTVNRADLYADFQGISFEPSDRERFVCRARETTSYVTGDRLTGFAFGKRGGGTISARIYDKTERVRGDGSDWWFEVWGADFDPQKPVWRVEFEFRSQVLGELGVRSPQDLLEECSSLWAYVTSGWLTHRDIALDCTKSRWPVSAEWLEVQKALLGSTSIPAERIVAGRRAGSVRLLLPALRGYAASVGALTGSEDVDSTCGIIRELIALDEEESGYPFSLRIVEKRRQLEVS